MSTPYEDYLYLLEQIKSDLAHLSDLAKDKAAAVSKDDLLALDAVIKQEQASALSFRGYEQKKETLLKELKLTDVPLSDLPSHYPPELFLQARKTVESLQNQYRVYQKCSEITRNVLECNIHQIEKILEDAAPAPAKGPGYASAEPSIPAPMKTDFRA